MLAIRLLLKLKELKLPFPSGIVAISPWVDLTASGDSYETNRDADPSMNAALLDSFTKNYSTDPQDPFVSPLLGELEGLPTSLNEALDALEQDLTDAAMADVCTGGNPRPCTWEEVLGVYKTAFGK